MILSVGVFTAGETRSVLHKQIQEVLTKCWLVGQNECYGAGYMRGKYSGYETHFQKTCKKAVYMFGAMHID